MNKEQLKQNIENMKSELANMEKQLADSDKVELKSGNFHLNGDGRITPSSAPYSYRNNGATRSTKELAEIASRNMVTRNKLEAYAMQIDPEWRDKGLRTDTYYISKHKKEYYCSWSNMYRSIGTVYMSKSTAEQICEWLNDGRITL